MHVFLCPALAAALCPGLPPEFHPSCAAVLKLCKRDTHSSRGHAFFWHFPHQPSSLQNTTKRLISYKRDIKWRRSVGSVVLGVDRDLLSPCLFFCISMQRSLMRWMLPRRRTSSLMHRFCKAHNLPFSVQILSDVMINIHYELGALVVNWPCLQI